MEENASTTVAAAAGAAAPALAGNPLALLSIQAISLAQLMTTPTSTDGTKIAKEIAKIVYPIKHGVLGIPVGLRTILNAVAEDAEEMLPPSALKANVLVRKMTSGAAVRTIEGNEALDMLLPDAISKATRIVSEFEHTTFVLLANLDSIRDRYAGEKAFYTANSAGRRIPIDPAAILTVIQNCVADLNRLTAGYKGYEVLALVNHVSAIGNLLADEDLVIPGVGNKTQLLNKVGFRMQPVHGAAHTALVDFYEQLETVSANLTADACFDLIISAMHLRGSLDQANTYGENPSTLGEKKSRW